MQEAGLAAPRDPPPGSARRREQDWQREKLPCNSALVKVAAHGTGGFEAGCTLRPLPIWDQEAGINWVGAECEMGRGCHWEPLAVSIPGPLHALR